jgi:hypothetical protein
MHGGICGLLQVFGAEVVHVCEELRELGGHLEELEIVYS